jgi:hypothetical protein
VPSAPAEKPAESTDEGELPAGADAADPDAADAVDTDVAVAEDAAVVEEAMADMAHETEQLSLQSREIE